MVRCPPPTSTARAIRPLLVVAVLSTAACAPGEGADPGVLAASAGDPGRASTTIATGTSTPLPDTDTAAPTTRSANAPGTTTAPTTTSTTTTTAASTTSSTTSTIREPEWPRHISMAFSGDTLPHSPLWRQAERNAEAAGGTGHDFDPMLSQLAPVVSAVDLAVCHLETPIAPEGEEFTTMPLYGVPEEVADAIVTAGYDRCSTASNHTYDRGTAGIDRTVDVLEARGLGQSGMARIPEEILPSLFEVDGVAFSHLSYTFSYNGLSLPDDQQWRSAVIEPSRIVDDARLARALGADVVLVSMHWGAEGVHQPTSWQHDVADEITADGLIDLVIGHHAHVLQPIEQVNDTWVLYGLGNILSNLPTSDRWPAASQDAAVVTVDITVDEQGDVIVERPLVYPTWVDKDAGWTAVLVETELARDDLSDGQRGRLERSLERTRAVLGDYLAPSFPGGYECLC